MTFSSPKAQEIYERMRMGGKINHSVGLAKKHIARKEQYQPGPDWTYDSLGLREELKHELGGSVTDFGDSDLDQVVKWLFDMATLSK